MNLRFLWWAWRFSCPVKSK